MGYVCGVACVVLPPAGVVKLEVVALPPPIAVAKGVAAGLGCMGACVLDCDAGAPDCGWAPCEGSVDADTGRKETVGTVCAGAYCKGVLIDAGGGGLVEDSGGGTLLEGSPALTLGAWVPK